MLLSVPRCSRVFLPGFHAKSIIILCRHGGSLSGTAGGVIFGNGVRRVASARLHVHLHTARHGTSIFSPSDHCTMRRSAVSAAFHDVCLKLSTFLSTGAREQRLLLKRQPPHFSSSFSRTVTLANSSFREITLGTRSTHSCFLLIKPPKAKGASETLHEVIRRFCTTSSVRVLLLTCAGQTISRVYRSLSSVAPNVSCVQIKDRLSYSMHFEKRLLRGVLTRYGDEERIGVHVTSYEMCIKAITSVTTGTRLFGLGHFSMTVISRTARVLRPRLLNVLYTGFTSREGTINGFVLVNSRGRLPTIVLRGDKRSRIRSRKLERTKLFGLGSSLFRQLCHFRLGRRSPGTVSVLYHRKHVRPKITFFPGGTFCTKGLRTLKLPRRLRRVRTPMHFVPSGRSLRDISKGAGECRTRVITNLTGRICLTRRRRFSPGQALKIVAPCQDRVTLVHGRLRTLTVPTLDEVSVSAIRQCRNDRHSIVVCSFYIGRLCRLEFLPGLARRSNMRVSHGLGITLAHTHGRLFVAKIPRVLDRGSVCRCLLGAVC